MERGINRAKSSEIAKSVYSKQVETNAYKGTCVFISHKSTDLDAAVVVSNYLRNNGIDVYIDVDDDDLQVAAGEKNSQEIVSYIQDGLRLSTHLLAVISDDTKSSWWVPYEIGFAKRGGKKIASLMLSKSVVDFPDYLKIERTLSNVSDFKSYTSDVMAAKDEFVEIMGETDPVAEDFELYEYIKR